MECRAGSAEQPYAFISHVSNLPLHSPPPSHFSPAFAFFRCWCHRMRFACHLILFFSFSWFTFVPCQFITNGMSIRSVIIQISTMPSYHIDIFQFCCRNYVCVFFFNILRSCIVKSNGFFFFLIFIFLFASFLFVLFFSVGPVGLIFLWKMQYPAAWSIDMIQRIDDSTIWFLNSTLCMFPFQITFNPPLPKPNPFHSFIHSSLNHSTPPLPLLPLPIQWKKRPWNRNRQFTMKQRQMWNALPENDRKATNFLFSHIVC